MTKKYTKCVIVSPDGYVICELKNGHKGPCKLKDISVSTFIQPSKPKTSTIEKMSNDDLVLVNNLVSLSATLYDRMANPPKVGPHTNPAEIDSLKSQVLLMAMRVGERVWYPRGNPGSTTSLNIPRIKKKTH